jgi:capsid protein
MQLQVLEIDWLDSSKNGTVGGNTIINGVEYTPLGKVSAYWLFDQHPGEMVGTMRKSASRAVPADRVIHLYNPERPGQGRGAEAAE